MNWEVVLRNFLLQDAAVQMALSGRIYPLSLPPSASFPAATYQLISFPRALTLASGATAGRALLQMSVWAPLWVAARNAARSITAAIDGRRIDDELSSLVLSVYLVSERDRKDEELNLFARDLDFSVFVENIA